MEHLTMLQARGPLLVLQEAYPATIAPLRPPHPDRFGPHGYQGAQRRSRPALLGQDQHRVPLAAGQLGKSSLEPDRQPQVASQVQHEQAEGTRAQQPVSGPAGGKAE